MKNLLIILTLLVSFSFADEYKITPYSSDDNKIEHTIENTNETFTPGVAIDAYPNELNGFGFKIAYEGDFMILNDYMPKEKKIKKNNYYIGVGYKF